MQGRPLYLLFGITEESIWKKNPPAHSATVRMMLLHLNNVIGSIIMQHFRKTGGPFEIIPTESSASHLSSQCQLTT